MTVKATGTHAKLSRRTTKALQRHNHLVEQLVAEGMDRDEAVERAYSDMRQNGKGDWRRG